MAAIVLAAAPMVVSVAVVSPAAADTFPGAPGVPQTPRSLYVGENFEYSDTATPVSLPNYRTLAPYNDISYTADPAWLTNCNGTILRADMAWGNTGPTNGCSVRGLTEMRQLAGAIGAFKKLLPYDPEPLPALNHVLIGHTDGADPGAGKVELQTNQLTRSLQNRFVAAEMVTGALNCDVPGQAPPLYQFNLLVGDSGQKVIPIGEELNGCDGGTDTSFPAIVVQGAAVPEMTARLATRTTKNALLYTDPSKQIGVQLLNQQSSAIGNNGAIDNFRLLDVSPQMDQAFVPAAIERGAPSALTFSITNTTDLGAKSGFSFAETLPAGLTVAPAPGFASFCSSVSATGATAGASAMTFTGTLGLGVASCTLSVNVSGGLGGYVNDVANVTSAVGLSLPAAAALTITGPRGGQPGVPLPPETLYFEDFQAPPPGNYVHQPRSLADYVGAAPLLPTYTADPAWLRSCNGTIMDFEVNYSYSVDSNGCSFQAFNDLRSLSYAMGQHQSTYSEDWYFNKTLTGHTDTGGVGVDPGRESVEFQTAAPLPLSLTNRFVGFSFTTGAFNCDKAGWAPPLYQFNVLSGNTVEPVGEQFNACAGGTTYTPFPIVIGGSALPRITAQVASRTTSSGALVSGSSLVVQLLNQQASGTGNDGAVDNIKFLDVTPQLDQKFSQPSIRVWGTAALQFTVTNTSELGAKGSFSFTDNLPSKLIVATHPGFSSTCSAATVVGASPGSKAVTFTGSLNSGVSSCTFAVNVSGGMPGTYTNTPVANVLNLVGLNAPLESSLTINKRVGFCHHC